MQEIIIKFRRVIEGEYRVPANTSRQDAEKMLTVELACGCVPAKVVEIHFEFPEKEVESA